MASLAGKNVVVATMTSSGKSLCYNLPVLEALSHDLSSSALYMFPTKVNCSIFLNSLRFRVLQSVFSVLLNSFKFCLFSVNYLGKLGSLSYHFCSSR